MKSYELFFVAFIFCCLVASCGKPKQKEEISEDAPPVAERIKQFADVKITADMSHLTANEKELVKLLCEAGQLADKIYWKQTAIDAVSTRDSLMKLNTPEAKTMLEYVKLHYGPYDAFYQGARFVGKGPAKKPSVANLYPQDITKEEFETYVKTHPEEKEALESQYSVVIRDNGKLKAIPYNKEYPEVAELAAKLEQAAKVCDDPQLKKYLELRAKAVRTDDYFESDMAWMDVRDSKIDVVIGPIENYEDAMFNYKTAYEAVVVVKDDDGTKKLKMFEDNIEAMGQALPVDKKHIPATAGSDNQLKICNVVYFGGDCQGGVKTIATSLPNDPRVHEKKGGKKLMYRNMMEAKFDKIVVPISKIILAPELLQFIDKESFVNFVTLHEVSHTLGPRYVQGNDTLSCRKALQEKYSSIEECKADALGLFNNKYLLSKGLITEDYIKKSITTYVVGLYRSLRFGAEEAHGAANLMQLNYLREKEAIKFNDKSLITINYANFFNALEGLVKEVIEIEGNGDYAKACGLLDKYGKMNIEIKNIVEKLKTVPRDINTTYDY